MVATCSREPIGNQFCKSPPLKLLQTWRRVLSPDVIKLSGQYCSQKTSCQVTQTHVIAFDQWRAWFLYSERKSYVKRDYQTSMFLFWFIKSFSSSRAFYILAQLIDIQTSTPRKKWRYRNYLSVPEKSDTIEIISLFLNAHYYTPENWMKLYLYLSILKRFRFVQIFKRPSQANCGFIVLRQSNYNNRTFPIVSLFSGTLCI